MKNSVDGAEVTSDELQTFLTSCAAVKQDLNLIIISLRRRQLSGAHQCAKATIEIIRALVGRYNFNCAAHMMKYIRAVGRELISAAPSELIVGNLVRRVLFLIREEYANQIKEAASAINITTQISQKSATGKATPPRQQQQKSNQRDRSGSNLSLGSTGSAGGSSSSSSSLWGTGSASGVTAGVAALSVTARDSNDAVSGEFKSSSALPAPTQFDNTTSAQPQYSMLDSMLDNRFHLQRSSDDGSEEEFSRFFPGLRAAVIGALNELNNEVDNSTEVCRRAQDHVHADECILTYGYNKLVEQFLRAAGAKRRFQVIIAEAHPGFDGHKLAVALSKIPSISTTLIPDSNIYAIMARVNKVILSPHAIMADGGAISRSGHALVANAAKELSVPVVCVSGAFSLTPLFAHNQDTVLNQLLSPAEALPYNANINANNVEVNYPAFDYLPPDLVALYVTNDGSQLPSYVFRQLSEYYHPDDYDLFAQ